MHHFIEHTRRKKSGDYILLIIDEFDSHSTILFFEFVVVNNIILFRFSTHSIHFIQFLDVGVFQSYKHYHAEAVDTAVKLKNKKFEKLKFLIAYQIFRTQIFKFFTIRHVFRIIDIVFFNFNMMLDIIRQKINRKTYEFRIFSFQFRLVNHISENFEFIRKFEKKNRTNVEKREFQRKHVE